MANGGTVTFPISFLYFARCVQNVVNSGYEFINIISVDNSSASYSIRLATGQGTTAHVMWIAIGF